MPRTTRTHRHKSHFNFHLSIQVPTPTVVLFTLSLVTYYIANNNLFLRLVGILLLLSAIGYWNAFWWGNYTIFKQALTKISKQRVLIINAYDISPLSREITALGNRAEVEIANDDLSALPYSNGEFDVVIVNYAFQEIKPRLKQVKAMQEAARVTKPNGNIRIIVKGFGVERYRVFLRQSGFTNLMVQNNGWRGWWSGPWWPSFTITGKKW
ncbi:class I SAM-dependent methyltransferase [Nicoliella lavandulae]|uniref:Class I SAM-dependent methyltransferase n=1 Tax=Nicoliella lavandulae TaxID=3082954 RepID=A0ABU8SMQ8_9LACO